MCEQLICELRTKCDTCHQCVECLALDAKAATAIERMMKCIGLLRQASCQSHIGHWDRQGTHGQNCPECLRTRALRERAEAALRGE